MNDDETIWKVKLPRGGRLQLCDVIQHEGKLWLVPWWLEYNLPGVCIPGRAIRMDSMEHIRLPKVLAEEERCDFVINDTLPEFLFEDADLPPQAAQYEILEKPDVCRKLGAVH